MKQTSFVLFLMVVSFGLGWHFACEADPDCTDSKSSPAVTAPPKTSVHAHDAGRR